MTDLERLKQIKKNDGLHRAWGHSGMDQKDWVNKNRKWIDQHLRDKKKRKKKT